MWWSTYNNMGSVFQSQGKYEEALKIYCKSLDIKIKALGEEHPSVADKYKNIGALFKSQGRYEEVLEMYCKSEEINVNGWADVLTID